MVKILIVEDEADVREDIVDVLELEGFDVVEAADGLEGLAQAAAHKPDLIISDMSMPRLDGSGFFKRLHAEHPDIADIPFLFLTAHGDKESELAGRELGASDYLAKPVDFEILVARLKSQFVSAKKASRQVNRRLAALLKNNSIGDGLLENADEGQILDDLMARYQYVLDSMNEPILAMENFDRAELHFRTTVEAKNIAMILSKAAPDPERVAVGYVEIFVNAVEHGNLGLTYADKSRLLASGEWENEVERRLADPAFADKQVKLIYERSQEKITVTIQDEGAGFDFEKYLEIDASRMMDLHGRGIAFAKSISFDRLDYQGNGNSVVAEIDLQSEKGS